MASTSDLEYELEDAQVRYKLLAEDRDRLKEENADLKQRLEMHKAEAKAAVMQRNQAEKTAREAREIVGRVLAEKATWIPVGERLPTEPNDVLVLGDVGVTTGYYIQPTEQIYGRWAGNSNVTHWMPLPERP